MNNYVDYMLMNFYIGNTDWPGHNWYMARPEDSSPTTLDSTGFKFFPWDSEMATGLQWAYDPNINSMTGGWWGGWMATTFNSLMNNADFRTLFADHAQKFLFNGGPLTTAAAQARYLALANEVQQAIVAESARWGDVSGTLYTPSDWTNDRDYVLNTWLAQRTNIVIQQLRNAGLYPSVDAPSYGVNGAAQYGGLFNPGDTLTITASASPIYYTLDGSDPRLPGGGLNPNAILYTGPITLTQSVEVKARVYAGGIWSALADAGFYVDLAPSIRITEMMYHPTAGDGRRDRPRLHRQRQQRFRVHRDQEHRRQHAAAGGAAVRQRHHVHLPQRLAGAEPVHAGRRQSDGVPHPLSRRSARR